MSYHASAPEENGYTEASFSALGQGVVAVSTTCSIPGWEYQSEKTIEFYNLVTEIVLPDDGSNVTGYQKCG